MGFPDKPEPKSEHVEKLFKEIEKPFKEIEKQFKAELKDIKEHKDKDKESFKAEHKDIKEKDTKEHKEHKDKDKESFKAEHKDIKAEAKAEVKEHVEQPFGKGKDKEVFEGGGVEPPGGDPVALLHSLNARVSSLEEHLGVGAQAFVQPEERPPVGGSVAKAAKERPSKADKPSQAGKAD